MTSPTKTPFLARLGLFTARHRWPVIGVWIVLTLAGALASGQLSSRWNQSSAVPGQPAYEGGQRTLDAFGTGVRAPNVVVFHSAGDATKNAAIEQAIERAAATMPGARSSSYFSTGNPIYASKDRSTTFAVVYPPGEARFDRLSDAEHMRAAAATGLPAGVTVEVTGRDALSEASKQGTGDSPSLLIEALIGGLGALVILLFVFRTLPAVLMPLAVAIAAILNTFTLVLALTYVTDVSIVVQFLIALVGLGVAIDYALLMIFRFRDELRDGRDVEAAIVTTMTHAGRSVIVSGSTVAVGLLSMLVLPLPFIRSIGIGGMLIPAVSVVTAITLLPALLATLGNRINSVRLLPKRLVDRGHPEDGWWGRWASLVMRRPVPVAVVGLAIVGLLVYSGLQLNPSEAQAKDFPGTGDAINGREALADAGISAGVMKPFVVLVENGADRRPIVVKLNQTPGVAGAVAPPGPEWIKGPNSLIEAFPSTDGATKEVRETIKDVRGELRGTGGTLGGV